MNMSCFIGTAGASYPEWRKGVFFPKTVKQADELKYYSGKLSTLEINTTFHGLPKEETFKKWKKETADGFVLCLKASQELTHIRRLDNIDERWKFFYERAHSCLGDKLGPILFQLPPTFKKDVKKLDYLGSLIPIGCRVAVEFRSDTWYCDEVYDIMKQHKMAIVDNVSPDNSYKRCTEVTAPFTYTRFHKYKDVTKVTKYNTKFLEDYAQLAIDRYNNKVEQFIMFMNEHEGYGPKNANELMEIIAKKAGVKTKAQLAPGWRATRDIKKGGPGSISSFFKAAQPKKNDASSSPSTDNKKPVEKESKKHATDEPLTSTTKRAKPSSTVEV